MEPIRLSNGQLVEVRPVAPEDFEELQRTVLAMDPETVRLRFLGGRIPRPDELRRIVDVDHGRSDALVALDPDGHLAGLGQYFGLGNGRADVAVAIAPSWRHLGLATALMKRLAAKAYESGIRVVHAEYYASNRDVHDLLRELGDVVSHEVSSGLVEEEVALDVSRLL